MTFAVVADVEALLRREVTNGELPFVNRLLGMADDAITAEVPGVSFDAVVTGATATFERVIGDEIWLPGRPVVQVTEVTVDGEVVDPDLYVSSRWGPLRRRCLDWSAWRTIQVTWDYGMASPPGDVTNVAADLVSRQLHDPGRTRQETIGQYSYTSADPTAAALELGSDHRRRLRRYKIRLTSLPVESDNPWWKVLRPITTREF